MFRALIGADELEAICSKIGLEQRPDQISATLAAIDYHGDGKVEWEEFYIWVSEESESAIELRDSMKTMMAQEQKPWPYIAGKSEALQELVESGPFDVAVMGIVIANVTEFANGEIARLRRSFAKWGASYL